MTMPMQRKCSFRFLVLDGGDGYVITQDARRSKGVVTGCYMIRHLAHFKYQIRAVARAHGCSVIVRRKRDRGEYDHPVGHMRYPK